MSARSLKDLDQIQEKGSFRLNARQGRSLTAGMVLLLVLAFLVGLQVGIAVTPEEPEIAHQDVASADRTIAEILDAYAATPTTAPAPPAPPEAVAMEPEPTVVPIQPDDAVASEEIEEPPEEETVEPPVEVDGPEPIVVEAIPEPASTGPALPALSPGPFGVQLAAFPSREEADGLAQVLTNSGVSPYIMEAAVQGQRWYRVRVGPYRNRADAEAWIPELAKHTEFAPIVVKD